MLTFSHRAKKSSENKYVSPPSGQAAGSYRWSGGLFEKKGHKLQSFTFNEINPGSETGLLKRLSPFLLLAIILILLFPFLILTGKVSVHSDWLLVSFFPFVEVNTLFFDFVIWNYFKGKKVYRIWFIEIGILLFIGLLSAVIL